VPLAVLIENARGGAPGCINIAPLGLSYHTAKNPMSQRHRIF